MIHGHRGAAQELLLPSLSRFTAQRKSSSIPFTIHEHLHPFVDSRLPRRSSGSPRPLSRFTVVTAPQAIHDHHRTNNHTEDVENISYKNVVVNEGSSGVASNVISMEDEEQ